MTAADLVAAYVFGQRFRYLRLSVTEVCNFRCTYCLPEGYRKSETVNFLSLVRSQALASARYVSQAVSQPSGGISQN